MAVETLRRPQNGIDSMLEGASTAQALMDSILNQARARQRLPYELAGQKARTDLANQEIQNSPMKMELLKQRIQAEMERTNAEKMKAANMETPDQKSARARDTAYYGNRVKDAMGVLSEGREIQRIHNIASNLSDMLKKNPKLTSQWQGLSSRANISKDSDLGKFDTYTNELQALMARRGSRQGGAKALAWAARAKPGLFKTGEYNLGMLKGILQDAEQEHGDYSSQFKEATGHEYPVKVSPYDFGEDNKQNPAGSSMPQEYGNTDMSRIGKHAKYGAKEGEVVSVRPENEMVKVRDNQTGEVKIMTRAQANKLMGM